MKTDKRISLQELKAKAVEAGDTLTVYVFGKDILALCQELELYREQRRVPFNSKRYLEIDDALDAIEFGEFPKG